MREAAKQFETMFTQQLLKSMRDSTMNSDMMDNEGTKMGTEMLDSQWATKIAGLPGGLSDVIARQLERQMGIARRRPRRPAAAAAPVDPLQPARRRAAAEGAAISSRRHQAAAAAEKATGIPATFMIAQAAHETGWGREIKNADGTTSYNLFGIKAGADWNGAIDRDHDHRVHRRPGAQGDATFRAYALDEESFADYASR